MTIPPFVLEVKLNGKQFPNLEAAMQEMSTRYQGLEAKWTQVAKEELRQFLNQIADEMRERHSGTWPGGTSGSRMARRSGGMINSIRQSVQVNGETLASLRGTMGVADKYAIHERGGTIVPKRGQYLTIPLPAALNSQGLPIKSSVRKWGETKVTREVNNKRYVYREKGRGQKEFLYVLVKQATIPARLGMRSYASQQFTAFEQRLAKRLEQEIMVNA